MKDLLDIILDENNTAPIVLSGDDGKRVTFEQVAVIPFDGKRERELYVILKPLDVIDGVGSDEAIVFRVCENEYGAYLRVEENEQTAIRVFDMYYDLIDAELDRKSHKKAG